MIRPSLNCGCGFCLWLPYPASPGSQNEGDWTPKDFLSREIACPECGNTATYSARDVRWADAGTVEHAPGSDAAICWYIETVCDEPQCELAIGFHWLTGGQSGPEEVRFRTLRLFERGFFKNLVCGRGHRPGTRIPGARRVEAGKGLGSIRRDP